MSETTVDTVSLRTLMYGLITIISAATFGAVGETCNSFGVDCSGRPAAVIAFAVFSTILALGLFVINVMELFSSSMVEILLSATLFALVTVYTAVITSPRTEIALVIIQVISWGAEVFAFTALFLALASGDRPSFELRSPKTKDIETGTPEATTSTTAAPTQYAPPPAQPAAPVPGTA